MSSLQQLVARDGGGRGLLGLGDLGIVFNKPKQSGGCILFYFSVSPLPGKGVEDLLGRSKVKCARYPPCVCLLSPLGREGGVELLSNL